MPRNMKHRIVIICLWIFVSGLKAQDLENLNPKNNFEWGFRTSLSAQFYKNLGKTDQRQNPFFFTYNLQPVVGIYGFYLPFSLVITKNSFDVEGKFQRFSLSPYYKWAKLHLGNTNLSLSEYCLTGQNIEGAGLELSPKGLRFAFVMGRFNKSIFIDSLSESYENRPSAFTRKGYAAKVGFGNSNNFFDINYLKAKDDENSLAYYNPNTSRAPAENAVVDFAGQVKIFQNLTVKGEVAASVYNRNNLSENLEFDSLSPSQTNAIDKFFSKIMPLKNSSQLNFAMNGGFLLAYPNWDIGATYKKIDPEYKSLGTFYMATDIEEYLANLRVSLLQGKLNLSGNGGTQRNNLSKTMLVEDKRLIYSFDINSTPLPSISFGLNFGNFGTKQIAVRTGLIDSFGLASTSRNLSFFATIGLDKAKKNMVNLNFSQQNTKIIAGLSSLPQKNNSSQIVVSYSRQIGDQSFGGTFGLNQNKFDETNQQKMITAGVTHGYAPQKGKLSNQSNLNFSLNNFNGSFQGFTLAGNSLANFKVDKMQQMSANLMVSYTVGAPSYDGTDTKINFGEFLLSVNYNLNYKGKKNKKNEKN